MDYELEHLHRGGGGRPGTPGRPHINIATADLGLGLLPPGNHRCCVMQMQD